MIHRIGLVAIFAVSFPLAPALAQSVHVVDQSSGPGADFTTIIAAVTSAESGDIVLVRSGDYRGEPVGIDKSLVLIADAGHTVSIGSTLVRNLSRGDYVVLHGLSQFWPEIPSATFANNAGPVWIEEFTSAPPPGRLVGGGFDVVDCATVALVDCSIAAPLYSGSSASTDAIVSVNSGLSLRGSDITGGSDGGNALSARASSVEVMDSVLAGGDGLDASFCVFACCQGEDGGNGVSATHGSDLALLGAAITAGARGNPFGFGCSQNTAVNGSAIRLSESTVHKLPGVAGRFELPSPVRENASVTMTFEGRPGDVVWLVYDVVPGPIRFPAGAISGVHVPTTRQSLRVGVIDGTGSMVVTLSAPSLPPGAEGLCFFTQALFQDRTAKRFAPGPTRSLCVLSANL